MDVRKLVQQLQAQVVEAFPGVKTMAHSFMAPALLHNLLLAHGVAGATIVKGYAIVVKDKAYFTHFWVRVDELNYDPSTEILCRGRGVASAGLVLSLEAPPATEYKRLDEATKDHALAVYDLYVKNPSSYWAGAPRAIRLKRRLWLRKAQPAAAVTE